jgi:hypothetical protein
MNTSPSTPNLELLRKAIQEYQPDPTRIPFSNLKPFHDSIMELRGKNASYAAIADLLIQTGVKTSRARGRIRSYRPGGRQATQATEARQEHARRQHSCYASKCAGRGQKNSADRCADCYEQ